MDMITIVRRDPKPGETVFGGRGVLVPVFGFKRGRPTEPNPPPADPSVASTEPAVPAPTPLDDGPGETS
jgi:hypothetical protein